MTDQNTCSSPTKAKPLIFRINENGPDALREVLLERGWEEFIEGEHDEHEWNIWWRSNRFRASDHEDVMPWQRLNHFQKTFAITRKDMLARNMRRMRGVYGASVYNFTPMSFNLPNDYTKFVAEYTRSINQQQEEQHEANASGESQVAKRDLWICKPADLSRGRGIFIFKDLNELAYDCAAVAQKYLTNPLLIGGYKFDLRIYVLVTSFLPLNIYVYQEGIARFSTEKFDLTSFDNLYAHLTNTSINKTSPSYTMDKERVGPGCKWSLANLRNYFHQQNIDYDVIWQRINNVIIWTILAQATTVPKSSCCFELFGFDIIIDENLKPWLLEVNFSPALGLDCPTDYTVKKPMLNDLIEILNYKESDGERGGEMYNRLTKLKHLHAFGKKGGGSRSKTQTSRGPAPRKPGVSPARTTSRVKPTPSKSSLPTRTSQKNQNSNSTQLKRASRNSSLSSIHSSSRSLSNDSIGRSKKTSVKSSSSTDDLLDDDDDEVAAVCAKSSSESKLNEAKGSAVPDRRSRLSLPTRRVTSQLDLPNERAGSLDSIQLPSVQESRRQLDSRREAIRQRQEQKNASTSPARRGRAMGKSININDSPIRDPPGNRQTPGQRQSRLPQAQNVRSSQQYIGRSASDIPIRSAKDSSKRDGSQGRNQNDTKTSSSGSPMQIRTTQIQHSKQSATGQSKSGSKAKPGGASKPPPYQGGKKSEAASTANKNPPERVGDFIRTFPFNDATKRASFPTLDIRTIIRETQKQLRRTICKATSTRKRVAASTTYKVPINKGVLRNTRGPQTMASDGIKSDVAGTWASAKSHYETVKC